VIIHEYSAVLVIVLSCLGYAKVWNGLKRGSEHGRKKTKRRERKTDDVICGGETEIAFHHAHGSLGGGNDMRNEHPIFVHEGDVRGFDGDVCACFHGDANVGLRKRGRIVDAVADHDDDMSLRLIFFDDTNFIFGQKICAERYAQ
jgi:hypothetical protein